MKMRAISPNGYDIIGTDELVPGTALIVDGTYERGKDGILDFEWDGETKMFWDGQRTVEDANGERLFVDTEGELWPESKVQLVPCDDD